MRWAVAIAALAVFIAAGCQSAVSPSAPSSAAAPTADAPTAPAETSSAPAPSPACDRSNPDRLCILVLGDSIAAGTFLTGDDRWSSRLAALLAERLPGRPVTVVSRAAAGAGIADLETAVETARDLSDYQLAIVIEGVNDVGEVPLDTWQQRYAQVVADLEAAGITVVVGTAPPALQAGAFIDTYAPVAESLRQFASDGRPLLDIDEAWRQRGAGEVAGFYADLLHQTAAGQEAMAQLAADLVQEFESP